MVQSSQQRTKWNRGGRRYSRPRRRLFKFSLLRRSRYKSKASKYLLNKQGRSNTFMTLSRQRWRDRRQSRAWRESSLEKLKLLRIWHTKARTRNRQTKITKLRTKPQNKLANFTMRLYRLRKSRMMSRHHPMAMSNFSTRRRTDKNPTRSWRKLRLWSVHSRTKVTRSWIAKKASNSIISWFIATWLRQRKRRRRICQERRSQIPRRSWSSRLRRLSRVKLKTRLCISQ